VISLVDDITPVDVAMRNPRELITKRIEAQVDLKYFSG
jgi:hypothetical protein